tara:strand:+ start:101 stop:430 length:330 start_codon:yes stop_codon:yes gene_type:complete
MSKESWGTKRVCSCGNRFYDLNKKEIECPSCGETIDVEKLSIFALENNLRKKPITAPIEDKPAVTKEAKEDAGSNKEENIEIDNEEDTKIEVEEIIGDKKISKKDESDT